MKRLLVLTTLVFGIFACGEDPKNNDLYVEVLSDSVDFLGATMTPIGCDSSNKADPDFTQGDISFFRARPGKVECALLVERDGHNVLDLTERHGSRMGYISVGECQLAYSDISETVDGVSVFKISLEDGKLVNYLCGEREFTDLYFQALNPIVDENLLIMTDVNSGYSYRRFIPRITEDGKPSGTRMYDVMYSNRQKTTFDTNMLMQGDFGNGVTSNAMVDDEGHMFSDTGLIVEGQIFAPHHTQPASDIIPHAGFISELNQVGEVLLTDALPPNSVPVDYINGLSIKIKTNESFAGLWLECSDFFTGRIQMSSITSNEFSYTVPTPIATDDVYSCRVFDSAVSTTNLLTPDSGYDMRIFINDIPVLSFIENIVKIIIDEFGNIDVPMINHTFRIDSDVEIPAAQAPTVFYRYLYWKMAPLHAMGNNRYVSQELSDPMSYIESNASKNAGAEIVLERAPNDPYYTQTAQMYVNDISLEDAHITYLYRVNWLHLLNFDDDNDGIDESVIPIFDADDIGIRVNTSSIAPPWRIKS